MVDLVRKDGETFDQWCNRIVDEEKKENAWRERWDATIDKQRQKKAAKAWKAWVKRSMVPCGRKLAARRRALFIKYMNYKYGVHGICS